MKQQEGNIRAKLADLQGRLNAMEDLKKKAEMRLRLEDEGWTRATFDDLQTICKSILSIQASDPPTATHFRAAELRGIAKKIMAPFKVVEDCNRICEQMRSYESKLENGSGSYGNNLGLG